jgi:hypothetical protein
VTGYFVTVFFLGLAEEISRALTVPRPVPGHRLRDPFRCDLSLPVSSGGSGACHSLTGCPFLMTGTLSGSRSPGFPVPADRPVRPPMIWVKISFIAGFFSNPGSRPGGQGVRFLRNFTGR